MDDGRFSETTKRLLAKRVGYLCSNPNCGCSTVGPHLSEDKTISIGEGAHICAASPNGPRFDISMSDTERKSSDNGIWLCAICATKIDRDLERFSVDVLRHWKKNAEYKAQTQLDNPSSEHFRVAQPAIKPPLDYQRQALGQVITHLRKSGVKSLSLPQLERFLSEPLRDNIDPIFEPLSVQSVADAIDEFIHTGKLSIKNELLVLSKYNE